MDYYKALEYDIILQRLADCAVSEPAKEKCLSLLPAGSLPEAQRRMEETTQAKNILLKEGTPPLAKMSELQRTLDLIAIHAMLLPDQLAHVLSFLVSCRRMKSFLKRAESTGIEIAFYGGSIHDLADLEDEINRIVRNGQVDDRASHELYRLRQKIAGTGDQIKAKLDALLKKNKAWFSESFVTIKNGRYTLPVKREHKNDVVGTVVELSNSGGTCFIEPVSVRRLQEELSELIIEEEGEVRRILYALTALIEDHLPQIKRNIEAMETLDFLFAKGKFSVAMNAAPVHLTDDGDIRILHARHPLLRYDTAVPLDFAIGGDTHGVIITGPNTGGKTVALKTVGLLALMAQSGLHVCADARSSLCMRKRVLCDIGDGQSIAENLSTFSAHMKNILGILKQADEAALVLLDELGSGTDPAEGMGLAIAILDELREKSCLFVATTHYPEIKEYAAKTRGLVNARMAFDRESLLPLYRLEIGEAGESCALFIAQRLGMPAHMLIKAKAAAYGEKPIRDHDDAPADLIRVIAKEFVKAEEKPMALPHSQRFNIGDSVTVYPKQDIGIVYAKANEKGEVGVQVKGEKHLINHKRLKLKVKAEDLYPEDYDLSIVLDSVANRKARHVMKKRHEEGNVIVIKEGKPE